MLGEGVAFKFGEFPDEAGSEDAIDSDWIILIDFLAGDHFGEALSPARFKVLFFSFRDG